MIAWLTGRLHSRAADAVVIEVSGVGYRVAVPRSTIAALPESGGDVSLHIHTSLREDTLNLFGFATEQERDLFLLLTGVTGIGPKLALAVLSGIAAADLVLAVTRGDDEKLCSVPGVGRKTAARICLELKDKVRQVVPEVLSAPQAEPAAGTAEDAVSALLNLGYKRPTAEEAVKKAFHRNPGIRVEDLVREALGEMGKRTR